mgnify:CR=1 FL=1
MDERVRVRVMVRDREEMHKKEPIEAWMHLLGLGLGFEIGRKCAIRHR